MSHRDRLDVSVELVVFYYVIKKLMADAAMNVDFPDAVVLLYGLGSCLNCLGAISCLEDLVKGILWVVASDVFVVERLGLPLMLITMRPVPMLRFIRWPVLTQLEERDHPVLVLQLFALHFPKAKKGFFIIKLLTKRIELIS